MKKFILLLILISVSITNLYGCTTSNTPEDVSKRIEKNLNMLYTTVNNLDSIDNSYIANPDIYQLEDIKQENSSTTLIKKTIAIPNEDTIEQIETSNENLNENNIKEENNEPSLEIEDESNDNIKDEVSNKEIINEIVNSNTNNNNKLNSENDILENMDEEKIEEIVNETINDSELSKAEKNKVFEFLFENVRYNPRYVTEYNTNNAQVTLNNYLYKVQELYTMTADVIEANNTLYNKKEHLLNSIDNVKNQNFKIMNSQIIPNSQQLIALSNYAQDIKTTTKRLKDCNGQLNNEVNNISTTSSSYGLSKGIDIINSNYLKILNHIDVRITYINSAIVTLEQMSYIINEAELDISYAETNTPKTDINKEIVTDKIKSNVDSYNANKNNNLQNNENIYENNTNLKNDNIDTYDRLYDNIYTHGDNILIDGNSNNDIFPQKNNVANNNTLHNLPNSNIYNNTVNGVYQNGIITQNNLNNGVNNGPNGHLTGYSGSYGYMDYLYPNLPGRTFNNVNSYGRNTLIDMINNGTVNNGINTLNINPSNKPIMVDGNI